MKITLNTWLVAVGIALFALVSPAQAQLVVGRDYKVLNPAQPVDDPAKIEVVEFFSYGCPHCSDLSPVILKWAAKLPADVVFKRIPVSFGRPQWLNLAKLFYALEVTGDLMRLDGAVFHAIHEEGLNLSTDRNLTEWATNKGVDAKKFGDAFASFNVDNLSKRGDQLARSAKIEGVPSVMVNGRYLVAVQSTHAEMLAVTDKLIALARTEQSTKKK